MYPFLVHTGRFGDVLDRRAIGAEAGELGGGRRFGKAGHPVAVVARNAQHLAAVEAVRRVVAEVRAGLDWCRRSAGAGSPDLASDGGRLSESSDAAFGSG
ncbi:hypothetical protein [Thauera butanivorans]|uniref:hypothetical protein n=1 Tax=Thauera butanivorans TaxID=86174 RepID=UPI001C3F221A|nr:hypothetical protein [Thauera butanivorans]